MRKNIIITGPPHAGKSSLLVKIMKEVPQKSGLITAETKRFGQRVGFMMGPIRDGVIDWTRAVTIAHVDLVTNICVSKYRVDSQVIQKLAVLARFEFHKIEKKAVLYLDEVGEMQLCSDQFRTLATEYLNSTIPCVATLTQVFNNEFTNTLRKRSDIILIELSEANRDGLAAFIPILIEKIGKAKLYAGNKDLFHRELDMVEVKGEHGIYAVNLRAKTCTCEFYQKHKEYHACSHILAAEEVHESKKAKA